MAKKKAPKAAGGMGHNQWRYDLVAIGASAGGLTALTEVLRPMMEDAPAILVVQHLDPTHKSHLAEVIARKTAKQVKQAEHGEPILPGFVYVAPPDEHLLVGPGNHNDVSEFPLIPHNGRRHRLMREFPDAISSN